MFTLEILSCLLSFKYCHVWEILKKEKRNYSDISQSSSLLIFLPSCHLILVTYFPPQLLFCFISPPQSVVSLSLLLAHELMPLTSGKSASESWKELRRNLIHKTSLSMFWRVINALWNQFLFRIGKERSAVSQQHYDHSFDLPQEPFFHIVRPWSERRQDYIS